MTAREMCGVVYRNRALAMLVRRHHLAPVVGLLAPERMAALERLRHRSRPTVYVTWHLGPASGISAAFERLGITSLGIARGAQPAVAQASHVVTVGSGEAARVEALWRAVQHLKAGGNVLIAADGTQGERTEPVTCLGRAIRLARGPFVLGRLSGASLVPIVSAWTPDGFLGVEAGTPLEGGIASSGAAEAEHAAACAMAGWVEERLLASPEQLRPRTLSWLITAPHAGRVPAGPLFEA